MEDIKQIVEEVKQKEEVKEEKEQKKTKRKTQKKKQTVTAEFIADNVIAFANAVKLQVKNENVNPLYAELWKDSFLKTCEKYGIENIGEEKPELILAVSSIALFLDVSNEQMKQSIFQRIKIKAYQIYTGLKNALSKLKKRK